MQQPHVAMIAAGGGLPLPGLADPDLRVRRIAPGDALGDVQRLRREVYFHEQGHYNDRGRRVSDGLDGCGNTLLVESEQRAIATLRLHDFDAAAVQVEYGNLFEVDTFARAWPLSSVAVATRFAVQADRRSKAVVDRLFDAAYRWAQHTGARFCLTACDPFLHSVFEHYGFREYLPPAILPGVELLRMALVVDDAPHLQACGSPLQWLVERPAEAVPARAWLERAFGAAD
ncbi:N-acyl amino acid synthase FeeM domain-containing protein [Pseudoxanthomonas mexicana]|uniref:N-acyl amino acid synthase FeeM domain-containing protein n=1 Tax=Pseudoxanthomonas mexicana TaxID=128785 RepID=UPI00398B188A